MGVYVSLSCIHAQVLVFFLRSSRQKEEGGWFLNMHSLPALGRLVGFTLK